MDTLITIFKVFFLLTLGARSVNMMYGDPVGEPTETMFAVVIDYAECPIGKYARPFIKVKGNETRFHVMKEFAYRTGCFDERESLLIGELALAANGFTSEASSWVGLHQQERCCLYWLLA